MSTIKELFQQTQLAEAAYANLSGIAGLPGTQPLTSRLTDSGMSESQAADFVTHWRVAHHISNTESGFSATLFERLDNGSGTGEYSLAIRGSTFAGVLPPMVDFLADGFDIFLDGVAIDQVVDLYNYWQQLRSPIGNYEAKELVTLDVESAALREAYLFSPVAGSAYEAVLRQRADIVIDKPTLTVRTIRPVNSFDLDDASLRQGAGLLLSAPLSMEVAGHSLGGHLAMAFARLFPTLGAEATSVNGLGFRSDNTNVNNLFAMLGGATSFDPASIQNLYGIDGLEFASMNNWVLQQPGGYDGIYIENSGFATSGGHRVTQMTDSLALYALFAQIDPDLDTPDPINAASRIAGRA